MQEKQSRRQFFKRTLGFLGGIGLARITSLFPETQSLLAQGEHEEIPNARPIQVEDSEFYNGFLLLPEEAPVPAFVSEVMHIDLHGGEDIFAGSSIQLDSLDELKEYVSFPMYIPSALPPNMEFVGATVYQFIKSGEIWGVYANFTTGDLKEEQITIWARPQYPKPFPVWPVRFPFAYDDGPILPEKINFTPASGVMLPSMSGYSLLWIDNDVLYSLFIENNPSREMVVAITNSLRQA